MASARDEHLDGIRALMAAHSPPLHGLVVPSEDAHQSEYVSEQDKRREFISGFTGSAGLALITMKEALLWTDGRYFLQATQQLSDRWKLMRMGEDPPVEAWIADNLADEAVIGINPWCISVDSAQRYENSFSKRHQTLFQLSSDLVDEVWKDRPLVEPRPVIVHPVEFAGRSVPEKMKELREKLVHEKATAIIITALDEVAWLYNIRGSDVDYSPVVHSYAIVTLHSAFFYVDKRKVTVEVQKYMSGNGIEIREYETVQSDASLLASGKLQSSVHVEKYMDEVESSKIWIDSGSCCLALYSKLSPHQVLTLQSPIALPKAVKNPTELDGLRKAHIRDGAAVVQYLAWLDNQMQENYGASGYFSEIKGSHKNEHLATKLTEVSVSDKLEGFRATKENFKGLSFPTISSVGPNAAVIHYKPEASTCSEMDADKIYLCDSGAQYLDGTTDITRTVHFGHALDILSRAPLWREGLDYRHGTGHGIGSYLNVHEGPHLISFRPSARNVPLQASMTVTDEPGYYEDGAFGIRLENVLICKDANAKFNFGDKGYLAFEHITWAPYQTKLIDTGLLTPVEIDWVNTYHSDCRKILEPHLNEQEKQWLMKATEPVAARG
ncbi:aminopeptidase P1 [Zea mays]|uniref:Aminopeptidase P1 n=1 Tax=Zea mays TaxID=4577 RepID=A0A1D6F6B1_MAIZE|nr:aminopeptidase P1 [Zea mays]